MDALIDIAEKSFRSLVVWALLLFIIFEFVQNLRPTRKAAVWSVHSAHVHGQHLFISVNIFCHLFSATIHF